MEQSQKQATSVAYIYGDYRDQAIQSPANILRSILQQLLTGSHITKTQMSEEITGRLPGIWKRNNIVKMEDVEAILKLTLSLFEHTYVCIDALDEL